MSRACWFNGEMDEKADVEVRSSATAGTWTQVLRFQGADASGTEQADLSAFGANDLQLRFRYFDAEWEWWWAIDRVELVGTARLSLCALAVGGSAALVVVSADQIAVNEFMACRSSSW